MQELRAQLQAQLKLADHLRKLGEQGGTSEVSLKSWNSSKGLPVLGIHVISAYTKFQQCRCITFVDMNIFLSAIFIFWRFDFIAI